MADIPDTTTEKRNDVVPSTPAKTADDALCIVCREPLKPGANECTKCSSYQSRFRNSVEFWARNVGLITAVVAAFLWIAATVPATWTALFGRTDLDVIVARAFLDDLPGAAPSQAVTIVIGNSGDRDIFVSHVRFFEGATESNQSVARKFDIFKSLAPHQLLQEGDTNKTHPELLPVHDIDDDSWKRMLNENYGCYRQQFFYERDQALLELHSRIPGFKTSPATGHIVYSPASRPGDLRTKTFPAVRAFWQKQDCKTSKR